MTTPQDVKHWIEAGLAESEAHVEGDGQHFEAIVICAAFAGKNMLKQHQLVYAALGDKMRADIHALSLRTLTPEEWRVSDRHS